MERFATPKQQRTIRFLLRKFPDTVLPLLSERPIGSLSIGGASEIISAVNERHPRPGQNTGGPIQPEPQPTPDPTPEPPAMGASPEPTTMPSSRSGYRPGSKQDVIARALGQNGMSVARTMAALADRIGEIPALTFTQNVNGTRAPLPMGTPNDDTQQPTQYGRALKTVYAVKRELERGGKIPQSEPTTPEPQPEPVNAPEPVRPATIPGDISSDEFYRKVQALRIFLDARAADGNRLDELGMRPVLNAKKMHEQGIPYRAALYAMTAHWPEDIRRQNGIADYDPATYGRADDGEHVNLPYCAALAAARTPQMWVGGAGVGKTHAAKQLADKLGLPFGMVPMTGGATPSWLVGAYTLDGYKTRPFVECYAKGGVFLFDEFDAGDPNMLLLVNGALANGFFQNPVTGEMIEQHPDFIAVAGANTMGLGADRNFTGRSRLDGATRDRFRMGVVKFKLDTTLERHLFFS
jgi:hypothetical protein